MTSSSSSIVEDNNNTDNIDLDDKERDILIQIVRNHIIKVFQELRNNELILANPPLSSMYEESYLVLLRHQNIQSRDTVRSLKKLINKISKTVEYNEEDLK